jgi:hypothetical protein
MDTTQKASSAHPFWNKAIHLDLSELAIGEELRSLKNAVTEPLLDSNYMDSLDPWGSSSHGYRSHASDL